VATLLTSVDYSDSLFFPMDVGLSLLLVEHVDVVPDLFSCPWLQTSFSWQMKKSIISDRPVGLLILNLNPI
jgi:hypothetical protein